MKKNNSVVAYVAVGDTSALQTVSDSCEASVGKACRREAPTVRVGVLLKQKRDEPSSIPFIYSIAINLIFFF
ncbi:MAG: hypothetical protein E7077_03215 [Bacteroidales bacterium]|jgi:hypothetical protein|nr:hypothetical protein [Bacteroidales bacterium]